LITNTDTLTSWLEGSTTGGTGVQQDWNNLKKEYSLSSQNIANRLVISYVLDLPFGHGKKFGGSATGVTNALIGGWGVDGVTTIQSGFPVKITYGGSGSALAASGLLGQSTLRPDVVPGCNKGVSVQPLLWFNPACFRRPGPTDPNIASWSFGNEPRVDPGLKQDGVVNFDFAAFKTLTFGERVNLQFRAEFFNLFNTPTFGPPNGTCCLENNGNFGVVTNTVGNPRLLQFGLKLSF
jgi:hypothetical protein